MSTAEIIGLIAAAGIVLFSALKFELIKGIAKRLTGAENSIWISILFLLIVACIPVLIGYFFVPENTEEVVENSEQPDLGTFVDLGETIVDHSIDVGKEIKESSDRKDSIYEATRESRWGYQIGDIVSDENVLHKNHLACAHIEDIKVFNYQKINISYSKSSTGQKIK